MSEISTGMILLIGIGILIVRIESAFQYSDPKTPMRLLAAVSPA